MTKREPFVKIIATENGTPIYSFGGFYLFIEPCAYEDVEVLQPINNFINKRLDIEIALVLKELVESMESEPCSASVYGHVAMANVAESMRNRCIDIVKSRAEWGRGKG